MIRSDETRKLMDEAGLFLDPQTIIFQARRWLGKGARYTDTQNMRRIGIQFGSQAIILQYSQRDEDSTSHADIPGQQGTLATAQDVNER